MSVWACIMKRYKPAGQKERKKKDLPCEALRLFSSQNPLPSTVTCGPFNFATPGSLLDTKSSQRLFQNKHWIWAKMGCSTLVEEQQDKIIFTLILQGAGGRGTCCQAWCPRIHTMRKGHRSAGAHEGLREEVSWVTLHGCFAEYSQDFLFVSPSSKC